MADKKYPFRKPNGKIIKVDWATMMEAVCDELTLKDGTVAVRARDLENNNVEKDERVELRPHVVSDALGFPTKDTKKWAKHLKDAGIKGVEFRPDPTCPEFTQVVCDSQAAKLRYAKSRGFHDKNSSNGGAAAITAREIEQAREMVSREHGTGKNLVLAGNDDDDER